VSESSNWKVCVPAADGEETCYELYAELPPVLDSQLADELASLADLEALAAEVADARLQVGLLEALDDAAVRLNTRLPGGAVLRRADVVVFHDDLDGVPGVIGMTTSDGFTALRSAGYQVKLKWEWESGFDLDTISDQTPGPGAPYPPPKLVYIWVRTLPPDPPADTDPPVIE